jgi:anhydro-N-acetylmuramic acid kinase
MFSHARFDRAIVNIGGIANISHLPPNACVRGFDCGPGNILMDGWSRKWLGQPMDEGGQWARTGAVVEELLKQWLAHPFFNMKPPKSTGRELFNDGWVTAHLAATETPQDVQRTLLELTARSVASALNVECADAMEIYACGGGAHNVFLMERIAQLLPGKNLAPSSTLGVDPDWVEALAFAWLARQTTNRLPGNLPLVTGAQGPRILGAIYQA